MSDMYTGVKVISDVPKEIIDELYKESRIPIWDKRYNLASYQNMYVVLKDERLNEDGSVLFPGSSSVITRVIGDELAKLPITKETSIAGIRAKNKEQIMALDALTDERIQVVTLTGRAGTGKTLLTLSAALQRVDQSMYDRIILTRPMTQVGKHDIGILPGEVHDKFGPYLRNYMCNFEHLLRGRKTIDDLIAMYNIEFIPLQLIRGASWPNAFIIADEIQTLNHHEMLTLGTRVGENSKIVIMGDLDQRDEKIAKEATGLYKFCNSTKSKLSPLVAHIELEKCERSEVARLFGDVFES